VKLGNKHRFLFESALHLKKHPARAFRTFCAELKRIHKVQAEDKTPNDKVSDKAA